MKQDGLISAAHSASAECQGQETAKPRVSFYTKYGKRILDLTASIILLASTLPIIAALTILVSLSGGTPFYGHLRVGKDGKLFKCWKLRSMHTDAEDILKKHLENDQLAKAEWQANFRLKNDPRVTTLGRFLRAKKLDELPQFYNVIKGEMSLVGPRPVTDAEIPKYGDGAAFYFAGKPGVTGPWQILSHSENTYLERVNIDIEYRNQVSLITDLKYIILTAVVILDLRSTRTSVPNSTHPET